METEIRAQIAFHLTGRRTGATTNAMAEAGLRPALLAPYRDLASLRYDFPVVLVKNPKDQPAIQSLTEVVDRLLATVATGEDKDRLIRHAHRLEAAIRALVAEVGGGVLRALWDEAGGRLGAHNDALVQDSLKRLRAALRIDGEVVDCDKALPLRALRHAWTQAAEAKALRVRATLDRLATKLADILGADFAHSDKGLSAENLRQGIGPAQRGLIDFDRMSTLLKRATPKIPLAETRRRRIEGLLAVLRGQKFYPLEPGAKAHGFAFAGCGPAMEAFRRRLPEMVDFAKAVAIAELEVDGRYHEARHGPFFEEFGKDGLSGDDLALFPDYLVSVGADDVAEVLKAFAAGLPAKVLVQTDDLLAPIPGGAGRLAFALGGKQLAATAVGLGGVYVLQSTSSNLLRCRDRLAQGVGYEGPALFNVFSGASNGASDLPPYLSAAAAHESRAFPCFVYDPSAGPDLADRFAVSDNPQPERDWPVHDFDYEDEAHQRISEDLPFTLVDYLACDRRYAGHFAVVPKAKANGIMAPVGDFLAGAGGDFAE
ncbi:MAG: hypothetical protein FJX47_16310, partial [Alphaproteobacteria bacterium]|nr:hypothetical protein [Alphaproteobacteria bacterium]